MLTYLRAALNRILGFFFKKLGRWVAAPSLEALERILRSLREPGLVAGTRTTIVLSSVFEKPGVVPVELD